MRARTKNVESNQPRPTLQLRSAGRVAAPAAGTGDIRRSAEDFHFTHHLLYGAIVVDNGVQFVVYSHSATALRILFYERVDDREPSVIVDFRNTDRWGDMWSMLVEGAGPGTLYHLQADGPFDPRRGHRFDGAARLIDPFAKALAGDFLTTENGDIIPPKCVVIDDDEFKWQGDRHLRGNLSEAVIYEMHVRGFTQSKTSGVKHPGTYLGVIEKIPYLKDLGVTAIELMPVHEFPIKGWHGETFALPNYWGYDPLAFFAPHRGYAVDQSPGGQVREFKEMVRALHQAGIEVILDVVFNHTCEGNERGPTLSFKGLENQVYYMLDEQGRYRNYTGCGNTVNGNHPIVQEMIFHCLRHWVLNYHVDGFRFDLASILKRDRSGELLPSLSVVESIAEDPVLADTKIIAEAWDAAGAYQVGSFANTRWSEWNGRYRDDVRRFWRGDIGTLGAMATRLAGSSDLYEPSGRQPYHSINFITSHDGFTMNDLVSYNYKHNEANGEDNRDGDNHNLSYNYGEEGPTDDPQIDEVRQRQIKNFLATLLLSQGVPMLLAGDECRRTQRGNNNAYCQDNDMSWFNWKLVDGNQDILRFARSLIDFRRKERVVRRKHFLQGRPEWEHGLPDVAWYGPEGRGVNWNFGDLSLMCLFGAAPSEKGEAPSRHVLMLLHAEAEPREFILPEDLRHFPWRTFIDTSAKSPRDIFPQLDGPRLHRHRVEMAPRSFKCLLAPSGG
jgi:isoamylase